MTPKIGVNDANRNIDLTKNSIIYAISTPDIGQKAAILTHSQIMTIEKFLALATQKKKFLPVTYLRSFRGPGFVYHFLIKKKSIMNVGL